MLDDMATTANSVEIDPFGLQPGEADQVGARHCGGAVDAGRGERAAPAAPKLDVSGAWDVRVTSCTASGRIG